MRKKLLLLAAVACIFLSAASESKAQFSAGLRIGFNASKYTGDVGSNVKFAPGLHIGPYFRVGFKEKYRVQADILFCTKGAVSTFNTGSGTEKFYDIPFYIDVPVMFNYKPVAGLYIEAGVQPSFAMTTLTFSTNVETEFANNSKSGIKTLDFAPVAGLGYEFKKVSLGLRGAFGVTNISSFSSSTYVYKNMTLMATFGFKF